MKRLMISKIKTAFFFSVLTSFSLVWAEPWIANRFAQNCASCHAPGRLNRESLDRRCTLTCQGCHVSPQGGGMRNQYGVWNQKHWLRSFKTGFLNEESAPAPLKNQPYAGRILELANSSNKFYGDKKPTEFIRGYKPEDEKLTSAERLPTARPGEPQWRNSRGTKVTLPPENFYDQHATQEWKAVVATKADFESTIPADDPYWLERQMGAYASGDFRYFQVSSNQPILAGKKSAAWLMAADIGVRLRPTKTHKFSGVVEARFLNGPGDTKPEDGFDSAQVKSAYLMVDDVAYNSFLMYGLYRPMFGHYDPDHTTIANKITGFSQYAVYKGVSFGAAPNVPYFNISYLSPYKNTGAEYLTTKGFVANAGARFVSFGASAAVSLWKTEFLKTGSDLFWKRDMAALTMGFSLGRYIFNTEVLSAKVTNPGGSVQGGLVYSLYNKLRLFRENYLVVNYSAANVARGDLTQTQISETNNPNAGSSKDVSFGLKMFPVSNLEIEVLNITRDDVVKTEPEVASKVNLLQIQMHAYF